VLYAGTEFGLYVTLDRGKSWSKLGGLPTVAVDDIAVHPRERDLVIATHGRSLYVLDDVRPIEELDATVRGKAAHLFPIEKASGRHPLPGFSDWSGAAEYRGANPPDGAILSFWIGEPSYDQAKIEIKNAQGQTVANLVAPALKGIGARELGPEADEGRPDRLRQRRRPARAPRHVRGDAFGRKYQVDPEVRGRDRSGGGDAMTSWDRYRSWLYDDPGSGFRLDVSRMDLPGDWEKSYAEPFSAAFDAMEALESGAIANPDEGRMVGHYWLRAPELSPSDEIGSAIRGTLTRVLAFAEGVHHGRIRPDAAERFTDLLTIGIGGSALGPQFVAEALGSPASRLEPHFLDNTDPDGFDRLFARIGPRLGTTLTVVISKSGGTPETRNGMLEAAAAYAKRGFALGPHAVAITQEGSRLDRFAVEQSFLERFPMWDWVGGRTSETSAVGLLPAALQGIDVRGDPRRSGRDGRASRACGGARQPRRAPGARVAPRRCRARPEGHGHPPVQGPARAFVALPPAARHGIPREGARSLGARRASGDRRLREQGLDRPARYVQQLREGSQLLRDLRRGAQGPGRRGRGGRAGVTSGDFLSGFLQGRGARSTTTDAARSRSRSGEVTPRTVGMLIALYERAVGLYASLVGVNAYHQPGVEAGKKAAASVLDLQAKLVAALAARGQAGGTAEALAADAGAADEVETAFVILEHLAANPSRGVGKVPRRDPVRRGVTAPCDEAAGRRGLPRNGAPAPGGAGVGGGNRPRGPSVVPARALRAAPASFGIQVEGLRIDLGPGRLTIAKGTLIPVEGLSGAARELLVFGDARFSLETDDPIETYQVELFTGAKRIDVARRARGAGHPGDEASARPHLAPRARGAFPPDDGGGEGSPRILARVPRVSPRAPRISS
jgi:glucose-6-phosphate isomerase